MPSPVMSQVRRGRVAINQWTYDRSITIEERRIALEVTRANCNHCPTCQGRVEEFKRALARKPSLEHSWVFDQGSYWLVLPKPEGNEPLEYLREVLDLSRISFA